MISRSVSGLKIRLATKNPPDSGGSVELSGIEPLTYALRTHRSPN